MSRIGKKPITIPSGTEVKVSGQTVTVKGAGGTLVREFKPAVNFSVDGGSVVLSPAENNHETEALWGAYASHVANMIKGVNQPFQKKLITEGVGFKADIKGDELVLNVGFSHPLKIKIPKGLKVAAEKGAISISGMDFELVGKFAATVRDFKKPEPYKGKGIRYEGEVVRRKQGKKTV